MATGPTAIAHMWGLKGMDTNLKEQQKNKSLLATLSLPALAVLACLAALNLRSGAGVWVSLPLYPLCVAAACFLKVKLWQRVALFPLFTAVVCLGESDTPWEVLPYMGMSFLCLCLVTTGVWLLRKKDIKKGLLGGGLVALYLVSSFFVLGNPFQAISKGAVLNDYIADRYGEGSHFTQVWYDTSSGYYTVTAYNEKYPTETAEIFLMNDRVVDHYKELVEEQATREQAKKITDVLRKAFPQDTFAVYGRQVDGFMTDGKQYLPGEDVISPDRMHFYVEIGAETSVEKYLDAMAWYRKILDAAGVEYASVTFLGGTNFYYRTAVFTRPQKSIFPVSPQVSVHVRRHPEQYGFLADLPLPLITP